MKIRPTSDHQRAVWKRVAVQLSSAEVRRDAFSWSNIANSFRSKTGWNGALNLLQEARTLGFYMVLWDFCPLIHSCSFMLSYIEWLANINKPTTPPLLVPCSTSLFLFYFSCSFVNFFTIAIRISYFLNHIAMSVYCIHIFV